MNAFRANHPPRLPAAVSRRTHWQFLLDVVTQVVNTSMLPIVIAVLLTLAQTVLPVEHQLGGWYLRVLTMLSMLVSGIGLWGGLAMFV